MCPPHAVVPVGSHSTDLWGRCSTCGAWVWSVDDRGKWMYSNEWILDAKLAEAAFVRGDVQAAAKLLVEHDLPYGPVWETPSALVDMLRAITPSANDRARSEALDAVPPKGRWVPAAELLRERVSSAPPEASELVFAMDVKFPGRRLEEAYEVGETLVVFEGRNLIRIDRKTGVASVELPAPGVFLARTADVLVFESGKRVFQCDAAGGVTSLPLDRSYVVRPIDDGFWLFDPGGDVRVDGSAAGGTSPWRSVEIHRPDMQPRVKLAMRGYPIARRMGEGWVLSQCVDDEGHDQALTLFDASFESVACSEGVTGSRSIAVIDDRSLWCETIDAPFVLERWERRERSLVRTFDLAVQSWARTNGGVVVRPRDVEQPLIGLDDRGEKRFTLERKSWQGATYLQATKTAMLVYDDATAEIFEPRTGERLVPAWHVDGPDVRRASDGTLFVRSEDVLFTIGDGDPARLFVGETMKLETTCGDAALLRDANGACLLVGSDGQPRARFDAPNARFSVTGTRRGPYVVEPERVRLV